jgi:hypothetical protein
VNSKEEAGIGSSKLAKEMKTYLNKKEFSDVCIDVAGIFIPIYYSRFKEDHFTPISVFFSLGVLHYWYQRSHLTDSKCRRNMNGRPLMTNYLAKYGG